MDEPQLKANGSMVVLDLGKKRKKAIRQLRKGKGKLLKRLHASLEDLRTESAIAPDSQVVVVVVRQRKKKRGLLGML